MGKKRRLSRRALLKWVGCTALVAVPAGFYTTAFEPSWIEVCRVDVPLRNLPPAFDGFFIAQLSDLHYSLATPLRLIRTAIATVNSLKPDLVALTGDFVSWHCCDSFPPLREALKDLRAPHGAFATLGNHDPIAVGRDINEHLAPLGIRALENETASVRKSGEEICVTGVNQFEAFRDSLAPRLRPDQTNIVLSHNPDVVDVLQGAPVHLALTGHTHGGQVRFPLLGAPILPLRHTELVSGMYMLGNLRLYVNRGIGCLTLRVRLNSRPEITLFRLKRSADG